MNPIDLSETYKSYIACLNRQDWTDLATFVHDDVHHNGRPIGLAGYRAMLEQDFRAIPDLQFTILLLVTDATFVASRLEFNCTPIATFLGLSVNGKNVSFTENVFYQFRMKKIDQVWSIVDKAAIESQL